MIFWIENQFKNEYIDSAKQTGIRCVFPKGFDEDTKNEIKRFIKFIRANYYFPIRVNVTFDNKIHFINQTDGHKYYGVFYDGDADKKTYPQIYIAAKHTPKNSIEDILFNIAHELTHYYQWYFLEDEKRTDRSLEMEANKWTKYLLYTYYCENPN
ncbi:MAG: hypothetical protein E7650_01140 [Ruminococcaceae bacterium]|nr:hypothetical protein [Oscillospiraceae bacterium]